MCQQLHSVIHLPAAHTWVSMTLITGNAFFGATLPSWIATNPIWYQLLRRILWIQMTTGVLVPTGECCNIGTEKTCPGTLEDVAACWLHLTPFIPPLLFSLSFSNSNNEIKMCVIVIVYILSAIILILPAKSGHFCKVGAFLTGPHNIKGLFKGQGWG